MQGLRGCTLAPDSVPMQSPRRIICQCNRRRADARIVQPIHQCYDFVMGELSLAGAERRRLRLVMGFWWWWWGGMQELSGDAFAPGLVVGAYAVWVGLSAVLLLNLVIALMAKALADDDEEVTPPHHHHPYYIIDIYNVILYI